MFHRVRGKNVAFDRSCQIATWNPTKTGGCLFTKEPLTDKRPVHLTLSGTGGVELGILDRDPEQLRGNPLVTLVKAVGYHFLNDIKIHKRSCPMKFSINQRAQEVTSNYGSGHYTQHIEPDKQYWLAIDVRYGEVELQINNKANDNCPQQFSSVHGNNIQLLNDPTVARSCRKSPGSLCFYKQPVYSGLRLILQCTSRAHQGMVPGRYYVKLSYTTETPEQTFHEYPDLFDMARKKDREPDLKQIETFEKEECTGSIVLDFIGADLEYKSASGKFNRKCSILASNKDVWLAVEVYGVEIRLTESNPVPLSDTAVGRNVFDAKGFIPRQHGSQSFFQVSTQPPDQTPEDEGTAMQTDSVFLVQGQGDRVITAYSRQASGVSDQAVGDQPMETQDTDDLYDLSGPIRKKWTTLIDSFEAKHFKDHMFESGLITLKIFEELPDKCTKEVLIILSKRRVSKKFMLHALEKTAQSHLLNCFFPENEKE